ncbi:MAG: serine/threonine-protein kinase [Phycisphaerales bacterium]|nr:serine/threonine-protein kinase [Phycisphaerales bacterium]
MISKQATMPTEIHGYRVIDLLGEGAASRLYVVSDPRSRDLFALKHVNCRDASARRFLAQVEREYELGSKVDHPAVRSARKLLRYREIVRTTEVSLILDFVDGVPLDESPRATTHELLEQFATIADGLHHLHELGYAHADLKPGNILVDATGQATLIDLGQSCRLDERKPRVQGTPGFLAPEQAAVGIIDARTDAFLLGATIYRQLTGRYGSTEMLNARSPVESLRRLLPDLPLEIDELVHACLEEAPARRPGDLSVVADRLRDLSNLCAEGRFPRSLKRPA